jgi:hypothetical protein
MANSNSSLKNNLVLFLWFADIVLYLVPKMSDFLPVLLLL